MIAYLAGRRTLFIERYGLLGMGTASGSRISGAACQCS
jgi:hypothetical protein